MTVAFVLLVLGALAAATAPRLLSRAQWPEREPVLALWVWQCVVAAVLLCCLLAMALAGSAAWAAVRGNVFAFAPSGVVEAYGLSDHGHWAGWLAVLLALGGVWTAAMLTREVRAARTRRRQRRREVFARAPRLPGESVPPGERLVVLEDARSDAWWLSGAAPRLVVTTAALRRLKGRQLDAVLAHEQGHARARHDLLLHCAGALAAAFPQVPVFAAFRDQVHHLVELAADDTASRRFGRLTTALALVELNEERGVFGPSPAPPGAVPGRVHRLLDPAPRLPLGRRVRMTAYALLLPAVPLLIAFGPGLHALT
ncbi:M56 family metallopeptidase [Actinacidiphila sp. DG2A-62]|jgi:Zn-dependent protease with chaperone function|uniref:M56 family metallopeptidase n=1 Tax=Actinacidiphila sp. DG2A-62 TaxID=3108821 RepID=UPI002DB6E506|nr:M56 family metallopeptidase [Actinacidiphila sp. DG2A-62]MEC3998393.1 M56 family metallopeptidase [Actinacidiphila sp. DG2A-62]